MSSPLFDDASGHTLPELLLALGISAILLTALTAVSLTFLESAARERAHDRANSEVSSVFRTLEKEVMMAGYALPNETRVAGDSDAGAGDQTFCKAHSDRLFIADGCKILRDVTDNHEEDGAIQGRFVTPIAGAKNGAKGGYAAQLAEDTVIGAPSLTVDTFDLNAGMEDEDSHAPDYDNDFLPGRALILATKGGNLVEGHRFVTAHFSSKTIDLQPHDSIGHSYPSAASLVVPATAWYVRIDPQGRTYSDGSPVYWLYRDREKALPFVERLKVEYGYDDNGDGLEWFRTIPPAAAVIDKFPFRLSQLKVLRITLTTRFLFKGTSTLTDYTKTILLRNQ